MEGMNKKITCRELTLSLKKQQIASPSISSDGSATNDVINGVIWGKRCGKAAPFLPPSLIFQAVIANRLWEVKQSILNMHNY